MNQVQIRQMLRMVHSSGIADQSRGMSLVAHDVMERQLWRDLSAEFSGVRKHLRTLNRSPHGHKKHRDQFAKTTGMVTRNSPTFSATSMSPSVCVSSLPVRVRTHVKVRG